MLACLQVGLRINTRLRDPAALTDCRGAPIWVGRRSGQFVPRLHDVHRVLPRKPVPPSRDDTLQVLCPLPQLLWSVANEQVVAGDGPHPSPELIPSPPGPNRSGPTGRAISVPFRARRHRFATVNHGHSRSPDLQAPYYRCAATRMVRTESPVRFRRLYSGGGAGWLVPMDGGGVKSG